MLKVCFWLFCPAVILCPNMLLSSVVSIKCFRISCVIFLHLMNNEFKHLPVFLKLKLILLSFSTISQVATTEYKLSTSAYLNLYYFSHLKSIKESDKKSPIRTKYSRCNRT